MFTTSYKGLFIHGYFDKPECSVVCDNGDRLGKFKSLHAAKIAITKFKTIST